MCAKAYEGYVNVMEIIGIEVFKFVNWLSLFLFSIVLFLIDLFL